MSFDVVLVIVALLAAMLLLSKKVRDYRAWRATVTPLASIIGSGFLVIVPLLGNAVGAYAPLAMLLVVVVAYVIGAAIRFNIRYAEPLIDAAGAPNQPAPKTLLTKLDYSADVALGFAYFISVTFYLRLLASFVLRGAGDNRVLLEQVLTTAILVFIGAAGWLRGLGFLERLEEYSVSVKLAIIAALIVGWSVHDVTQWGTVNVAALRPNGLSVWHVTRLLAGVLIVVQGFETSRYLGDEYDAQLRAATMARAQLLSGVIYVAFVALAVPSFGLLSARVDETAIITLSKSVASVLPAMLVVAAVMSQLSAAVADTVGSGGLFAQTVAKRFGWPAKVGYVLVATVGVVLVWTANIFVLVSLASRAFAIYYALQCLVAAAAANRSATGARRGALVAGFVGLAVLLAVAAAIAIPAG